MSWTPLRRRKNSSRRREAIEEGAGGGPRCNISSHGSASTGHGSIGKGVRLEEGVFVGHGVKFVNDADPWAVNADGSVPSATDWVLLETLAGARASIGGSAKILGGATIGEGALVGAGAVVTQDVPAHCVVVGAPAKVHGPRSAVRQRSQ